MDDQLLATWFPYQTKERALMEMNRENLGITDSLSVQLTPLIFFQRGFWIDHACLTGFSRRRVGSAMAIRSTTLTDDLSSKL